MVLFSLTRLFSLAAYQDVRHVRKYNPANPPKSIGSAPGNGVGDGSVNVPVIFSPPVF